MANLAGIIDGNPERRNRFTEQVQPRLLTFQWLRSSTFAIGRASLASATHPSAPQSLARDAGGAGCFILGNLSRDGVGSDAERLLARYRGQGPAGVAALNGYYLAFVSDGEEVTLGVDLMGLFPLYYHATPDLLLFATSPTFFLAHPSFRPELRPEGLAGILLTTHLVKDRTLWKGVQRLGLGNMLRWRPGEQASEIRVRTLEASRTYFDRSYESHLELADAILDQVVRRETTGRDMTVLLSGGLDSRLLAGYVHEQGRVHHAITLGGPDDIEMQCASLVARKLGWSHARLDDDYSTLSASGSMCVELEMLANGLNSPMPLRTLDAIHHSASWLLNGFIGDSVMGGGHVSEDYDDSQIQLTFDRRIQGVTRHGLAPAIIQRLVKPEVLGDCLESVVSDVKHAYEGGQGLPFQKSWLFELAHRVRFHTTATIVTRLSHASWSVMPFADEALLTAMLGMPASTLCNRRIEKDLLCRRFPALAKLPVDRNAMDMSSLLPGPREAAVSWLKRVTRYSRRRKQLRRWLGIPEPERRYYYRIHDINSPAWVALRREAEFHRKAAETIFDPSVLRELVPSPDMPITLADGIIDGANRKVLLGLMLWAGRHL